MVVIRNLVAVIIWKLVVQSGARVQCIIELHTSVQPYKARKSNGSYVEAGGGRIGSFC